MGGPRAAYTTAPRTAAATKSSGGSRGGVHAIRKGQSTQPPGDQTHDYGGADDSDGDSAFRTRKFDNNADDDDAGNEDDEEYEYDDDNDGLLERERELQRERAEMKARFTFQEHKKRNLKNDIMGAMRRKRRLLMRNENLRFRELYKPPEPGVLVTVVVLVTIVSLIITKSWPFY